jgi:hypothetical protein
MPRFRLQESACFAASLAFAMILCGCDPNGSKESKAEFPTCARTGRSFTTQELIDIVVRDQIRIMQATKLCRADYKTLHQFYQENPKCCEIDRAHLAGNQALRERNLGEDGWLIGSIQVKYYCGSEDDPRVGRQSIGSANITSCGVITDSAVGPNPLDGSDGAVRRSN